MIKHVQKTFKPNFADFSRAYRRLKFLHAANDGRHETEMIVRALTESDEPKPEVQTPAPATEGAEPEVAVA